MTEETTEAGGAATEGTNGTGEASAEETGKAAAGKASAEETGTGKAAAGETAPRRRGRPSRKAAADGPDARTRILEAARTEFAERGYDKTSVRGIAKAAGVDAALVHHYFGTKDGVFAAAVELTFEPALVLPAVLDGPPEGLGERLAAFFLSVWEDPGTRTPLLAILRSAVTHEAAANVLRDFVLRRLLERIAAELDVPDPTLRAELAASHMLGIVMLRYVVRAEPLASADPAEIVAMVAPTLQRYVAGR
ncbi:TetR family transcriptional regulator [Streptomyces californicus]|uniref:TetR/AcrR family transcriptional regulator n=1 Tax=Streptomyces californicus TaxID=67351 RepID=UPI003694C724